MHMLTDDVWLVDDDEDDLLLMQAALLIASPGLQLITMRDGEALLPQLAITQRLPGLILLDLNMPITNGFDTLRDLRGSNDYVQLPVVVFTTSDNPIDRNKCKSLGANDFCIKPSSFDEMTHLAERLVRQWLLKVATQ